MCATIYIYYIKLDTSPRREIIYCPGSFCATRPLLPITTEGYQRGLFEKVLWCQSHRPSPIDNPSWEPWRLASHHQPHCLLLWKHQQVFTLKYSWQEESQHYTIKLWQDVHQWLPAPACPISYKSACNQCRPPTSGSSFHLSKPWYIYIYIYIYTESEIIYLGLTKLHHLFGDFLISSEL